MTSVSGVFKPISASKCRELLEKNKNAVLLDVRSEAEYNSSRIPGAILLPDYNLARKAEVVLKDKNAEIIVYCLGGSRSRSACRTLASMGYTKVYDLGGITDWPYDTVSG